KLAEKVGAQMRHECERKNRQLFQLRLLPAYEPPQPGLVVAIRQGGRLKGGRDTEMRVQACRDDLADPIQRRSEIGGERRRTSRLFGVRGYLFSHSAILSRLPSGSTWYLPASRSRQ